MNPAYRATWRAGQIARLAEASATTPPYPYYPYYRLPDFTRLNPPAV